MSDISGVVSDISGSVAKVPSVKQIVLDMCAKSPKTKAEAIALYRYVMTSEIEPAIDALLEATISQLPALEQAVVKVAVKEAEVVLAKCGCF